jgi:hypothetical protein
MVEYMRQQVELAQQIVADELYVCDCEHKWIKCILYALPCN